MRTHSAVEDFSLPPALLHVSTAVDDNAPRGDGDGFAEPGETLAVTTTVQNTTGSPIPGVTGSITANNGAQVTGGTSNWPTIAAGKNGVNDPPFTVKLPEAIACEAKVALTVSVTGPNGPVAVPVTDRVSRQAVLHEQHRRPESDSRRPLRGGVNSTMTLPGTGNVSDLDVRIGSITHTYVGDLTDHSDPRRDDGGPREWSRAAHGDDFSNLVLDDEAALPLTALSGVSPPVVSPAGTGRTSRCRLSTGIRAVGPGP